MGKFAYRAYLDGIRGSAIFFVLLFHTSVGEFGVGYLGVDVFFVLSGYLITSIILREIDTTGRIDIFRFYARRARRILPGAAVTLLIVALFDRFADPITSSEHGKCFGAAASYWANYCFISEETDYWSNDVNNPVKHYWSLSVEEQYYLVYPFCLMLIMFVTLIVTRVTQFFVRRATEVYSFWRRKKLFSKGFEVIENEIEPGEELEHVVDEDHMEENNDEGPNNELVESILHAISIVPDNTILGHHEDDGETPNEPIQLEPSSSIHEEEKNKRNIKNNVCLKLLFFVCLLLVVVSSYVYCLYLTYFVNLSSAHMDSLGRIYELGAGGILSIILDLGFFNINFCSCFSSTTTGQRYCNFLFRTISLILVFTTFSMNLYPVLFPNVGQLQPAYSGILMTTVVILLIYFMELENAQQGESIDNNDGSRTEEQSPEPINSTPSLARRILCFPFFVYCGKWSYSLYLWHYPLITFGDQFFLLPTVEEYPISRVCWVLFGSLILALLSYYLVEKTFMKVGINKSFQKKVVASFGIFIPLTCFLLIYFVITPKRIVLDDFVFDDDDDILTNIPELEVDQGSFTDVRNFTDVSNFTTNNFTEVDNNGTALYYDVDDVWRVRRLAVYGDSHAFMAFPLWESIKKNYGVELMEMYGSAIPPYLVPYDYKKTVTKGWWMVLEHIPQEFTAFKPDLFVVHNQVFQYWCYIDKFCRWDAGVKPPKNFDWDAWERKLEKRLSEFFIQKMDPSGEVPILFVLPTPWIGLKATMPSKCAKIKKRNDKNVIVGTSCDVKAYHPRSYASIVRVLERIGEERGNFRTVNFDELVCPGGSCRPGVHLDRNHVSKDYWMAKEKSVVKSLEDIKIHLVPEEKDNFAEETYFCCAKKS